MTTIQEIYQWSKTLSAWQQDANARLYLNRELSPEDIEEASAAALASTFVRNFFARSSILCRHRLHERTRRRQGNRRGR